MIHLKQLIRLEILPKLQLLPVNCHFFQPTVAKSGWQLSDNDCRTFSRFPTYFRQPGFVRPRKAFLWILSTLLSFKYIETKFLQCLKTFLVVSWKLESATYFSISEMAFFWRYTVLMKDKWSNIPVLRVFRGFLEFQGRLF